MVQVQHISFKDWNPIGKPHKKPNGKNGILSDASLNRKNLSENKEPFGEAATLELTHDYVKEKTASTNMVSVSKITVRTLKISNTEDV